MIKPLGKNLLLRKRLRSRHTLGGITLPDSALTDDDRLMVVASKGPGVDAEIKEGDTVVLDQYALSSKHESPDGSFIIPQSSICMVIPA